MLTFEKATEKDLDAMERFYDEINDFLSRGVNYPGWRKGIYPNRETAEEGIAEGALYVAREDGRIAAGGILRNRPEPGYAQANWKVSLDAREVLVLYTFAVHPDFLRRGTGTKLLSFFLSLAEKSGARALRLDVCEQNLPAVRLYEKCGFRYVDTVDLGYSQYGLDRFLLYQYLF